MIGQTCCFTGHRILPIEQIRQIASKLDKELMKLIGQGYRYFGAGGALGFDTLAAQTVLRLREQYSQIKLILVLPCFTQSRSWENADRIIYETIREKADKVVYTSEAYTSGCMHKRNRHLVDHSSVCICYLEKPSGGTAYTVQYAKEHGKSVINIADLI